MLVLKKRREGVSSGKFAAAYADAEKMGSGLMNIGGNIQELRKISGMTQEQLAGKLNVSRQTVSKWELGGTLPDLESALKLCGIFHIPLDDLLGEEKKARGAEDRITIEDLAYLNRRSRNMNLLVISGLLFLMIALAVVSVVTAVRSAALSTQYMLYRYMTVGEYVASPANYAVPLALAAVTAASGAGLIVFCIVENKRGTCGRRPNGKESGCHLIG